MDKAQIERINELARKKKAEGARSILRSSAQTWKRRCRRCAWSRRTAPTSRLKRRRSTKKLLLHLEENGRPVRLICTDERVGE